MSPLKHNLLPVIIFLALVISLSLPHIHRYLALGSRYTTLVISGPAADQISWEETYTYATQANRIKNNQPVNDPYIYEYRNVPSPLLSELIPSLILGIPAKVFSIPFIFIVAKIILLPLTVFVWYLIARQLGYSKFPSVTAALANLILQKFFVYIPYADKLNQYLQSGYLEGLRIYFPLVSSFLTSLSILFLIKMLKTNRTHYAVISGFFLGSLFFTYFFAWTLLWGALALFSLSLLITYDQIIYKKYLLTLLIGSSIGFPYLLNLYSFYQNPVYNDFVLRTISFPITDWNIGIIFRFLGFLVLLIFFGKNWLKSNEKRFLIFLYLVATFLPLASKIILNSDNQTDHWYERFLYPLSTFLLVLFIADLKNLSVKTKNLIFLILIVLSFLKFDTAIYREITRPVHGFTLGKPRLDLYNWMENNLQKDSIIASLSFTEQVYLTANTPFYAYLPQAYKTIAPKQEILDRYINLAQIFGVSSRFITQSFIMPDEPYQSPNSEVAKDGNAFMMLIGIAYHFDPYPFPAHQKTQEEVISKLNQKVLQQGRIDYLLFGPLEKENATNFDKKSCKLLFNNGTYRVYDFKTCNNAKMANLYPD